MGSAHVAGSEVINVEVPGGALAVEVISSGTEPVLAIHGISSQRHAVHVCGMSMGGFVAVELATAHPGRVKSLILVDGGFPMAAPPGLTPEALPAVFKDRLARLEHEWPSVCDYAEFFGAGSAPAYPAEAARTFRDGLDALVTVQPVAGVDHPGSIMSPPGAGAAAGLILEALS
jgi:pimeloyl-ACP methyl ester carboxylesterase